MLVYKPHTGMSQRAIKRLYAAGIALCGIVLLSIAAVPPWFALQRERRARAIIGKYSRERAQAIAANGEVFERHRTLAAIRDFESSRRSMITLLAQLSDAIPQGSSIVSLRVDSTGGEAVILGERSMDVVQRIGRMRGIQQVAVVGPVVRQSGSAGDVDRFAVRFTITSTNEDRRPLELGDAVSIQKE